MAGFGGVFRSPEMTTYEGKKSRKNIFSALLGLFSDSDKRLSDKVSTIMRSYSLPKGGVHKPIVSETRRQAKADEAKKPDSVKSVEEQIIQSRRSLSRNKPVYGSIDKKDRRSAG